MPVITASTVKLVKPPAVEETESVSVADITWFTASVVFSLFQLTVIGPFAVVGFQFDTDKLNVI